MNGYLNVLFLLDCWGHKVLFRGEIFYRGVNFVWENDYICSKIEAKRWECGIKKYQVTYTVNRIS